MKKSILFMSLVLSAPAFAGTLADMRERQMKAEIAELDAKIEKSHPSPAVTPPPAQPLAVVSPPPAPEKKNDEVSARKNDLSLVSIFGIGQDLKADISIKGVLSQFGVGDIKEGWCLLTIDKDHVVLGKVSSGRKTGERKTLVMPATAMVGKPSQEVVSPVSPMSPLNGLPPLPGGR